MQVNYVDIYNHGYQMNPNTPRRIAAPKLTDFCLLLRNNVTFFEIKLKSLKCITQIEHV